MNLRTLTATVLQQAARIACSLAIGLVAIAIFCVPSAGEVLQFNRAEIAAGEVWRLATGHLTHWNLEHIQWDLMMFVALGAACEMRDPRRMWLCVVAAAASVSMLVFSLFPDIEAYRGLSGIDTALFTLLAIDLLRDARQRRIRMLTAVSGGLLLGFISKTAYEAATGQAFFVDQQSAGFQLLVWDHVVAAMVGAAIALADSPVQRRQRMHFSRVWLISAR
jgi:rhomboid family GlyGly-CTERM serine protease